MKRTILILGVTIFIIGCKQPICGDVNVDGKIDKRDVQTLNDYVFRNPDRPKGWKVADVNCDGDIDVADVKYLANYVAGTGAEPCAYCKKEQP